MFSKVLTLLNVEKPTNPVTTYAIKIAVGLNADFVLLSVLEEAEYPAVREAALFFNTAKTYEYIAKRFLERFHPESEIEIQQRVTYGSEAVGIRRTAEAEKADLVVISQDRRSRFWKILSRV